MSFQYEESLLNFDLDFLHQTSNKVVDINEKCRKAIGLTKKKIVATDSLIRKYYEKKEDVDHLDKTLYSTKEECKKAFIDIQNLTDKCTILENEAHILRTTNKELKEKCCHAESITGAIQSHANQLQILVKEHETMIESLKIENQLQRNSLRECEKKNTEMAILTRHISLMKDIIFGKRKLSASFKDILQKYHTNPECDDNDSLMGEEVTSDDEPDIDQLATLKTIHEIKSSQSTKDEYAQKDDKLFLTRVPDLDSDNSNEPASADTGRGSSLAFSDAEKCLNSPDYFMDHSPISADIKENNNKILVDIATSPIPLDNCDIIVKSIETPNVDVATSPMLTYSTNEIIVTIEAEDEPSTIKSKCHSFTDLEEETLNSCNNKDCINIGTKFSLDSSSSNVKTTDINKKKHNEVNFPAPACVDAEDCELPNGVVSTHCTQNDSNKSSKEKVCLELNNSDILNEDNSRDCEIEMILSRMRLNLVALTPIPSTPNITRQSCVNVSHKDIVCKDALKVREENKVLQQQIYQLIKDVEKLRSGLENGNIFPKHSTADQVTDMDDLIISQDIQNDHDSPRALNQCSPVQNDDTNEQNVSMLNDCVAHNDFRKSVKRLQFEDPLLSYDQNDASNPEDNLLEQETNIIDLSDNCLNQSESYHDQGHNTDSFNCNSCLSRPSKYRKLTKLERFRQKLVPKTKIKGFNSSPGNKIKKKHKQILTSKATSKSDLLAKLNNKNAYEKAVKVMTELKAQQKARELKQSRIKKYRRIHISNKSNENAKMILGRNCTTKELTTANTNISDKSNELVLSTGVNNTKTNQICILENILLAEGHDINKKDKIGHTLNNNIEMDTSQPFCSESKTSKESNKYLAVAQSNTHIEQLNSNIMDSNLKPDSILTPIPNSVKCDLINDETVKSKTDNIMSDHNIDKIVPGTTESTSDSIGCQIVCSKEILIPIIKCDEYTTADLVNNKLSPLKNVVGRSSQTKHVDGISNDPKEKINRSTNPDIINSPRNLQSVVEPEKSNSDVVQISRKRHRKNSADKSEIHCKRMLRSSSSRQSKEDESFIGSGMNINKSNNHTSEIVKTIKPTEHGELNSVERSEIDCMRMLRSSTLRQSKGDESFTGANIDTSTHIHKLVETIKPITERDKSEKPLIISYQDLDLFNENAKPCESTKIVDNNQPSSGHPKSSILCVMLDKYGKHSMKNFTKKIPDSIVTTISKTIEEQITLISDEFQNDTMPSMKTFLDIIQKWEYKPFMAGLMEYLKNHQRKVELFNKVSSPPAPPMTKSEQILLYIVKQLRTQWSSIDIVDGILCNIEYTLFKLNRTPEFDVIESMSHFYAIVCRYFQLKSRLRLFMLDAMYCIQFKAVTLIKQCLDVWMHVLPLAHMGIARSPIVMCMVYLLHFYKCEDKFNRVQEIRNILSRRYFYEITQWNEPKILDMFRNAIKNIRGFPIEMKLLRMALIVISKRHGPKWCQKNIIKNLLLPIIEKDGYSERSKLFCVSIMGPLLKPLPVDMKVHVEIVMNLFLDMLRRNPSPEMEEAIFTSLICMSRHSFNGVLQALLMWNPKGVSSEFEGVMRDFVSERPLKAWKGILTKISLN